MSKLGFLVAAVLYGIVAVSAYLVQSFTDVRSAAHLGAMFAWYIAMGFSAGCGLAAVTCSVFNVGLDGQRDARE